jgi:glutathione peroxidase
MLVYLARGDFQKTRNEATLTIYDIPAMTIDNQPATLEAYRGRVLLIVNVASKCGFTPQYAGLEALYEKYHERGFEVLAFPCDQFLHQEPGSEEEIKAFCSTKYSVTFPMFAKVKVNGEDTHPLWKFLKDARPGLFGSAAIKWNFTKFLVDRHGQVVKRYFAWTKPRRIEGDIERLLG